MGTSPGPLSVMQFEAEMNHHMEVDKELGLAGTPLKDCSKMLFQSPHVADDSGSVAVAPLTEGNLRAFDAQRRSRSRTPQRPPMNGSPLLGKLSALFV